MPEYIYVPILDATDYIICKSCILTFWNAPAINFDKLLLKELLYEKSYSTACD